VLLNPGDDFVDEALLELRFIMQLMETILHKER
jgi:hypothetical protein